MTANRSTAATCPPVEATIVITAPGVTWNVTLADLGCFACPVNGRACPLNGRPRQYVHSGNRKYVHSGNRKRA